MRFFLPVMVFLILAFGCCGQTGGGNGGGDERNYTYYNQSNYTGLKSEDELREIYDCQFGVGNEEKYGLISLWRCNKNADAYIFGSGMYEVGAHPIGTFLITYIIYDGEKYVDVTSPDQLTPYFAPIESEEEAISYVALKEGLLDRDEVSTLTYSGKTGAEKADDGYIVTIHYSDRDMCPCYGAFFKAVYEVKENGEITKISSEKVHSWQDLDCMC